MIDRRFLIIAATILHVVAVSSVTDHLLPPPPPQPTVPQQQLQPSLPAQPAARGGPPRQQGYPPNRYAGGAQNEPPGFMQRIARWFGFNDGRAQEPQGQASQQYAHYQDSPRGQQQDGRKAPCGLCNKYPWVPMFPGNIQYPLSKHYQVPQANQIHQVQWTQQQEHLHQQQLHHHRQQQLRQQHLAREEHDKLAGYNYPQQQQQLPAYPPLNTAESQYAPTQFQPPLVQRAIQFKEPPSQDFRPPPPPPAIKGNPPPSFVPQPHFAAIPLPNLSASAQPPVYDAQPFRPLPEQQPSVGPTQFQQLPKYQPSVQFHDQVHNTQFYQTQTTPYNEQHQQQLSNNDQPPIIENILAASEIQAAYPTQVPPNNFHDQYQAEQSKTTTNFRDQNQAQTTFHFQDQQQAQQNQQSHSTPSFEIIKSHQVSNFVSEIEYPADYVPSHSIDVPQEQQTTTQPPITLTELGSYNQEYTALPEEQLTPTTEGYFTDTDSIIYQNHQDADSYPADNYPSASSHNLTVQNDNHLDIDPIQHSSSENYHPQNEVFLPTPEPTTLEPQFETDVSQQTTVEIVPSLQTTFTNRLNFKRDRETPKRLLDSPIHYLQGGSSPRPFTRDPGELQFRSSTTTPPYLDQRVEAPSTPTPWHMSPTPTSTYTSIEASGHFAGMTPPQQPKKLHQIIIPYTTKHKPRPFQPKEQAGRYDNWATSNEFDPHEQQESKLVAATQTPGHRNNKYLTKILASNLRELLKKEHEVKNKSKSGFDLSKLQHNIDDWTEQEFTSLSHKASTVSLRGHSKHIPTEYLTTTPSMRESKTTIFAANHLEPLLFRDRGGKRYQYQHIDDNRIENLDVTSTTPVPSTTTVRTTTPELTTTTTTEAPTVTPFYIRAIPTTQAPKETWNQAKVTVSPLTKEKLYVVTPQPVYTPGNVGNFKSPRFIVRPTPAIAGSNTTPRPSSLYTPELFGLMGISAYIPAAPVETFDGHSKVITVVTPSSSIKVSKDNEAGSPTESVSESSNNDRSSS